MPIHKRYCLLLCISLLSITTLLGQDLTNDTKTWFGYAVNLSIGKRFKGKVSQLYSIDLRNILRLGFTQTDVMVAYKVMSRHYLQFEFSNAQYPWGSNFERLGRLNNALNLVGYQRLTLNYNFSHRLLKKNKKLKLKHYIIAQVFFPQPEKHRARFIYSFRLYYSDKKWFWRMSPYISSSVYYYLGGNPIAYYNEVGDVLAYQAPNGFHRFRIKTGVSFKPLKKTPLTITLYGIMQWEFNLNLFPYTQMNYRRPVPISSIRYPYEPNSTITEQPFNNYTTIGVQISYRIRIRLKRKKK